MTRDRPRPPRFLLFQLLGVLLFGLIAAQAMAQQGDPPGRVGHLNEIQGSVALSPAGDDEWTDALSNRPLTRGDRLWTDRGSLSELQLGATSVRMDSQTRLDITALDDEASQLSLMQGTASARVRLLREGENVEIDTPNLALRASQPGDYRLDVDPVRGTTRVTVRSGRATLYGEAGQALQLPGGQQITFGGRDLTQLSAPAAPAFDAFDRWTAERDRLEDESVSARYVPRDLPGYQQLDAYGDWVNDPGYGAVWYPRVAVADWAPYRAGHWAWIAPWGWTWIDEAPWGFAPMHYGRWAQRGARWCWVPGPIGPRPVYAPALVAFVGRGQGGLDWNLRLDSGRPGVAWFPLAPGEAWQPAFRASPRYLRNVNRQLAIDNGRPGLQGHQHRQQALTAVSAEDFNRGRPVRGHWQRLAANELARAQLVAPPSRPDRSGLREWPPAARIGPPPGPADRQVIAVQPQAAREQALQLQQAQREQLRRGQEARQMQQTQRIPQLPESQRQQDRDRVQRDPGQRLHEQQLRQQWQGQQARERLMQESLRQQQDRDRGHREQLLRQGQALQQHELRQQQAQAQAQAQQAQAQALQAQQSLRLQQATAQRQREQAERQQQRALERSQRERRMAPSERVQEMLRQQPVAPIGAAPPGGPHANGHGRGRN